MYTYIRDAAPFALRLLLLSTLLIAGCATTPAKIKRVKEELATCPYCRQEPLKESLPALAALIAAGPCSPTGQHALGHFVAAWKAQYPGQSEGALREDPRWRVRFRTGPGIFPIGYFDEIVPAWDLRIVGIRQHVRDGVGIPLCAYRKNAGREPIEKYYPPEGITRALTAVADVHSLPDGKREIEVALYCPVKCSTIVWNGQRKVLAADFSTPWANLLARTARLSQSAVTDLLTRAPSRQPQLYLMEDYDPQREPLVMIHGLFSTPLAWAKVSNELWADEEIRSRYQIWHYLYNTSAPPLYPARLLRTQLRELRPMLDPAQNDRAGRRTTLLAHSMGGIVAKALVVHPGDAFWKAAFTIPHERLKLSAADRLTLENAFDWEADPHIHRIIYCCVPHRGSAFADNLAGQIGRAITAPPDTFSAFYRRIYEDNPGAFTPEYSALGMGKLGSIDSLSPRQPTLKIMASLPVRRDVQQFSIIGATKSKLPLPETSDGVVPYWSSHLDDSVSEKVVSGNHGCYESDEAIEEMKRILKLPPN